MESSRQGELKIFSGNANLKLAEKIASILGEPLGQRELSRFSDGEILVHFEQNVRGTDTFIIQPTNAPADNLMELLLMIDAAKRSSASRITAVIPYFGYARQDRKDKPRTAISAKLVANLITVAGANRVLTMDLHSGGIQGFFDIPMDHLRSSSFMIPYLKKIINPGSTVVAPDIGSSKRARGYAALLSSGLAIIDKRRTNPDVVEEMTLVGEVQDQEVIMIDDMIDTAGTLCKAAKLLAAKGAKSIIAACTHPVLSGDAIHNLQQSLISKVIISDTIDTPVPDNEKFEVISSAQLLADAIQRIHNEESVSALFID